MSKDTYGGEIIRRARSRENPYAQILRRTLNDPALSWEATGLLAYLLDKPDDWQVRVGNLMNAHQGARRQKLQGMLRELEQAGYLVRTCHHGKDGRWRWESVIYEAPEDARAAIQPPEDENPVTVAPGAENPLTGKQAVYQNGRAPITELTDTEGHAPRPKELNVSMFKAQIRRDRPGLERSVIEQLVTDFKVSGAPDWLEWWKEVRGLY